VSYGRLAAEQISKAGTKVALTDLDARYAGLRGQLLAAVRRACPLRLASRADDLVQTALMRVLEVERRREGNAAFSTLYLRKAAHSALVDELRRLHRRREVALDEEGDLHQPIDPASDPERRCYGEEIGAAIQTCLRLLARARRQAAVLHLQGHSVPQIGRLLGWSPKKAENLVYRGLGDLRQCLRARGAEP